MDYNINRIIFPLLKKAFNVGGETDFDKLCNQNYIWLVANLILAMDNINIFERMKLGGIDLGEVIDWFFNDMISIPIFDTGDQKVPPCIRIAFSPAVFPVPKTTSKVCFGRCFNDGASNVIKIIIHTKAIRKFSKERFEFCVLHVLCHEIVHAIQKLSHKPVSEYEAELYAVELSSNLVELIHHDWSGEVATYDYIVDRADECEKPEYQGNPLELH